MKGVVLNVNAATYAGAAVGAVLSVLCAAIVSLSPGGAMMMTGYLFHLGLQMTPRAFSLVAIAYGAVVAAIIGAVTGFLTATFYNHFAKQ